ncbi:hypothetical protein QQ008_00505 [Fulvivirgaceae bacterium BMA10]|uniref:Intradiol ring-cleavage dioxygenases domain-containing protein n=1 Tax=Splendidivirga corallicola TaxID=3051826 RepID=A0ABT8KGG5_9BACT|nr:hypothetical protein [Fulvivirgaceae bacterium BMA10]
MKKKHISRKNFLKQAGLGFVLTPLAAINMATSSKEDNDIQDTSKCGYTNSAAAGPFYVKNSPESVNINFTNLPGTPMKITGKVLGGKGGSKPIKDAKIEVWHCDHKGKYHPQGSGDISNYDDAEIALRGTVFTDENGAYAFHSIKPGVYYGRRRHIHYKITAKGYKPLITQSYWLDEKGNQRERNDRTDRNTEDCRYIDFRDLGKDGWVGAFDIHLEKV